MPTIVDFPAIVKQAQEIFGDLFDHEPARQHVAAYLTGLMVAERQTITGINREFAVTTDPSCLNRWLTETGWEVYGLTDRRLQWLQRDPKTRYSPRGVIAIDNPLVDHAGKLIDDVGWCWDHAEQRHVIAHDDLMANDVCPSGAHYPIAWRRFKKQEACAASDCKDHTQLCLELIDDASARDIPGDFTFDRSFTHARVLTHIHGQRRSDVGDLKLNRKGVFEGGAQKRQEVARQMPWAKTRTCGQAPLLVLQQTDADSDGGPSGAHRVVVEGAQRP